jgi:hypothetical protein
MRGLIDVKFVGQAASLYEVASRFLGEWIYIDNFAVLHIAPNFLRLAAPCASHELRVSDPKPQFVLSPFDSLLDTKIVWRVSCQMGQQGMFLNQ